MMMGMAIGMNVLRGAGCVLVDDAPAVLSFVQAWCGTRGPCECKGYRRRQNAEQVGEREQARGR